MVPFPHSGCPVRGHYRSSVHLLHAHATCGVYLLVILPQQPAPPHSVSLSPLPNPPLRWEKCTLDGERHGSARTRTRGDISHNPQSAVSLVGGFIPDTRETVVSSSGSGPNVSFWIGYPSQISAKPLQNCQIFLRALRARNGRAGPSGRPKQRCPDQKVSARKSFISGTCIQLAKSPYEYSVWSKI